jgi:hypothetical protein
MQESLEHASYAQLAAGWRAWTDAAYSAGSWTAATMSAIVIGRYNPATVQSVVAENLERLEMVQASSTQSSWVQQTLEWLPQTLVSQSRSYDE